MTGRIRNCVVLGSGIALLGLIIGGFISYFEAGNDPERVGITASQISFLVSLAAFACTVSLIVISFCRSPVHVLLLSLKSSRIHQEIPGGKTR